MSATDDLEPTRSDRRAIASAAILLAFEPSPAFLRQVIRWLTDFCQLTLKDLDLVARLRLAVSELVENVVKYGMQPNVRMEVELLEGDGETTLRLSTRNRATPEYLRRAIELLTELKCAEDPLAYYDQLVRETAPKRGVSGLGLARIRAEGDLELYFAVEGDELRIWVEVAVDGSAQHIRSQNLQGQGAEAGEGTPSDEPPGSSTGAGEPTGSTTGEGT